MAEPSKDLVRVVQRSALPALLVRVPNEEIIAASEPAGHLLIDGPGKDLVGHSAEEYSADPPSGALVLVAQGRVNGFQASRTLRRCDGTKEPLQVWVRAGDREVPVGYAVAILWSGRRAPWMYLPARTEPDAEIHQIIGTVDAQLHVERISDDVRLLCMAPEDVIGSSFFTLFDVTSAVDVLQALADTTNSRRGLCLVVNVCRDDMPAMGELIIRPLSPAPSFSFCITVKDGSDDSTFPNDLRSFDTVGRGLHALGLAETLARFNEAGLKGADRLTTRETDIVCRLMDGDRVPAIAKALFLSQSTVRNHLSNVFHKLGVGSQQELIDLIRETAKGLGIQDTSSS